MQARFLRFAVGAAVLLSLALPAQAQFSSNELSFAYSYSPRGSGVFDREVAQGFSIASTQNLLPFFGFTSELVVEHGDANLTPVCIAIFPPLPGCDQAQSVGFDTVHVMSGPRAALPLDRGTFFVHGLFGTAITRVESFTVDSVRFPSQVDARFAWSLGGGFDLNLVSVLAWRVVQYDYVSVRVSDTWVRNHRLRTGIVLRF